MARLGLVGPHGRCREVSRSHRGDKRKCGGREGRENNTVQQNDQSVNTELHPGHDNGVILIGNALVARGFVGPHGHVRQSGVSEHQCVPDTIVH